MTIFVTTEAILRIASHYSLGPVRDLGLLESATARPQAIILGQPAYPDDTTRAAALLHSVVKNPPLVDGNKRLGWLACTVFLYLNHLESSLTQDQAFDLTTDVAKKSLDLPEIATRLQVIPSAPQRTVI